MPMKNLELSIDREVEFMLKNELTPNELFVLQTVFFAQDGHPEYLIKYFTQSNELELRSILKSLQDKGVINKSYKIPNKGEKFNPDDVDINKVVIKDYLKHSQEMGMELFTAYPAYTNINGKTFSLRNITKLYKNLDEMCFNYGKGINFDPNKHKEVMELLDWGKENNKIVSGICDFIESRKWLDLQVMQDGGVDDWNPAELV